MAVLGVVAEYNPFHLGHAYHLSESRRLLGEDAPVVCVMSGDFVQRGEAAVFPKHLRAEAALRCGADLVLELPLPWALSSAEGFARGAVSLLKEAGCTHLSFGSEAGTLAPLRAMAEELLLPETGEKIKRLLAAEPSLSYPKARSLALGEKGALLSTPNNLLGVEYLKAVEELRAPMEVLTVKRFGSAHDEEGSGPVRSARELRALLYEGRSLAGFVPPEAEALYREALPVDRIKLETALLSRLRMLPQEAFERLPDATEGLGLRLYRAAREEPRLEDICQRAKSKRYALSRLRRMTLCACLGITGEQSRGLPPYLRVLGATERGCALLAAIKQHSALSILTKPAAARALDGEARLLFEQTAAARDLYALGTDSPRGGEEWRRSPVILYSGEKT